MGKGAERLTPKQELYVQARARGLSQRAAYREAYPRSVNWKDSTVDSKACVLEADGKILARLRTLQNKSAEKAVITRSKLLSRLDGLADAAWEQVERCQASGAPIDRDASATLVKATSTLLPYALVDDGPADTVPPSDFGLLIAPPFLELHRAVHGSEGVDAWLPGGRSSGKSSAVSLEIVDGVIHNKDRSALVLMKNGEADLLIMDEINYAVKFGLLTIDEVLAVLDMRPSDMHVVLTGRDAAPELIERADLVTEMKLIKHPYEQGIAAQLGIEF